MPPPFRTASIVTRDASAVQITVSTTPETSAKSTVEKALQRKVIEELHSTTSFCNDELDALLSHYSALESREHDIDRDTFTKFMGLTFGGRSSTALNNIFTAMDSDGNGTINFKEFALALSAVYRGSKEDVYRFWFKMYDKDKNDLLDANELEDLFQEISSRERSRITVLVESTGSKDLDFDSFKQIMEQCAILPTFVNPQESDQGPAFAGLTASEKEVLFMLGTELSLEQGQKLIEENHVQKHIYFIVDGVLEMSRDGRVLGAREPGSFVGEAALFEDLKTPDTSGDIRFSTAATVLSPSLMVLQINIADVTPLVNHAHPGATAIIERLGRMLLEQFEADDAAYQEVIKAAAPNPATQTAHLDWANVRKALTRQWALRYHAVGRKGKLEVVATKMMGTKEDLSVAYSPGVAEPCLAIQANEQLAYEYTAKGHLVGVITNGTAVLGLGSIGALAGKPVMEGKAVLFKKFADVDAFDIEVNELDPQRLVDLVVALEPTFGGVNLEDIKAPECFFVERECQARMDIPVFHDDQHGTAIIASAGLLNVLELVDKKIEDIKVVVCGVGAAGYTSAMLFKTLGVQQKNLYCYDKDGVIYKGRPDIESNPELLHLQNVASDTPLRSLAQIIDGADVFLGLSAGGLLKPELLLKMARDPVIFACANPTPEIDPVLARATREDVIMATGRSDFPNQINNVCAFPYIFRGALDCRAKKVNLEMKLAAVNALAKLARLPVAASVEGGEPQVLFGRDYIIPKPFDERLLVEVSAAVVEAAVKSGVARRTDIDVVEYRRSLRDLSRTINRK